MADLRTAEAYMVANYEECVEGKGGKVITDGDGGNALSKYGAD